MNDLESAARLVRERYIAHFHACVEQLAEDGHVEPECEALDQSGEIVVEGPLGLPYRYDAALLADSGARTFTFECAALARFEPFSVVLDALTVRVQPFHWDHCEVNIEPVARDESLALIAEWFRGWFRAHAEPNDGTMDAVHFLSDPEVRGESTRFVVDFGTAPIEALFTLLTALAGCGVRRVSIAAPAPA